MLRRVDLRPSGERRRGSMAKFGGRRVYARTRGREERREEHLSMSATSLTTREQLVAAIASGTAVKWLLFWGHTPPADGGVGRHVLSQWWPAPFDVDGTTYRTAEHWMMAEKARLFDDAAAARAAIDADHPAEAKKAGRLVRGFDDATWNAHRVDIVVRGNVAKFGQHADLRAYLLGTGERVLVEASPRDRIWGIGLAASHEDATDPSRWRGANLLGFALMRARDLLRAEGP
jgi:ribA/ribD-fused uncharacterized protein